MREPRKVAARLERGEGRRVQLAASMRGDFTLDCEPGKFVPELDRVAVGDQDA
jgi:hypothetical protein